MDDAAQLASAAAIKQQESNDMSRYGSKKRKNRRAMLAPPLSGQPESGGAEIVGKPLPAYSPTRITYTTQNSRQKTARLQLAIHRAFVRWFQSAQSRLVLPARIIQVTHHRIIMDAGRFSGYLYPSLGSRGIEVHVEWDGEGFDIVWENEVSVKKGAGGYYCAQCLPDHAKSYPSREALWIEHVFEPFANWMNHTLARTNFLNFYATDEWGITDARLSETEHPGGLVFLGDLIQIASVTPDGTVQSRDTPLPNSCRVLNLKPVSKVSR